MTKTAILDIKDNPEQAKRIWQEIYEEDSSASPFMSWEWVNSWMRYFSHNRELRLVYAEDAGGDPVAMIPFMAEPAAAFRFTFANKIQILGSDSMACSEHLGFLLKDGVDISIANDLLTFIWQQYQGCKYISFSDMDTGSRSAKTITNWATKNGIKQQIKTKGGCWQTELPKTLDDFLAKLSRNFRQQIRRSMRKIDNSNSFSVQQITDRESIKHAAGKLAELNLKRMSVKKINSCFNSAEMHNFFIDMTVDMICANRAWLDVIYSDGKIIAAALHLVDKNSVAYYQGGFDEEFGKLRPMVVLFAKAIQRAIDNNCTVYDFLGGNEAYKQRWGAVLQPYTTVSLLPDSHARNIMIQLFELYQRVKSAKQYHVP